MDIRREGPDLAIILAPQPFGRAMVMRTVPLGLALAISAIFGSVVLSASDQGARIWAAVFSAGFATAAVRSFLRLVGFARNGQIPAVIRVSPAALSVHSKLLGRRGFREWPKNAISDVSLRHAGFMRGVLTQIRLQVVLHNEFAEVAYIPASGGEPLAVIEDNLRDVLGLPLTTSAHGPSDSSAPFGEAATSPRPSEDR